MNRIRGTLLTTFVLVATTLSANLSAEDVEVYLSDPIDGILNHYCIDVNGPPQGMQLESPLQAHTCYSYLGELTDDQRMDSEDIANDKFRIASVDMCAQLDGNEPGATVTLKDCSEIDEQKFELRANGQISPTSYPELCLTTGSTSWLGGTVEAPNENLARTLHLQRCGDEGLRYQRWSTRTEMPAQE